MDRNTTSIVKLKLLLSALLMAALASPTFATPVGIGTTLTGLEGKVNVIETDDGFGSIAYKVDVLDGSSIAAFAVSNGGAFSSAITERTGWSAMTLNAEDWDNGTEINQDASGVSFNTQDIGSYASIFGTDPLVSLYFNSFGSEIDEASDGIEQFYFGGVEFSDFVALTSNGSVIDGSSIPEPASMALLAMGGLAMANRRRRGRGRGQGRGSRSAKRAGMTNCSQ